jgi:rhodanese-related sulfurtransferase
MIRRILVQSAVLLICATAAGALVWKFHPEAPELYLSHESASPGEITVTEARARAAAGPVIWLDARHEKEYQAGHISGALLLNEYDWENLLSTAFHSIAEAAEGTPVIIYCDGQACAASRAVRDHLRQTPIGDRELLILHGGWPAWQAGAK